MLICPISTYGDSTGHIPIHVKIRKSATKNQNTNLAIGLNCELFILEVCVNGSVNNTNREAAKAITPNSLFGILLNIAYANRKYHSGTM